MRLAALGLFVVAVVMFTVAGWLIYPPAAFAVVGVAALVSARGLVIEADRSAQ